MTRKMLTLLTALVTIVSLLSACAAPTVTPPLPTFTPTSPAETRTPVSTPTASPLYLDPTAPIEARVEDLLARMTLAEKIGQMTQVEKNSITPEDVKTYFIGSLLSGGGGSPPRNTPESWADMIDGFQEYALQTRLGIPLIYGADAVHGHGNLKGATIFPHNIGLGATRDPDLVERIGRATAIEAAATGVYWNFAPVVAVPQDIRWGRTYEGYSQDTGLVSLLAAAYVRGLQNIGGVPALSDPSTVLATPKHFVGDGGTAWGSSTCIMMEHHCKLDQGVTDVDEATLRAVHLPPYIAAIEAGALSIMVSYSSWGGLKMHAQKYLLTDVLKGELGFQGFLVSDWQAIDQIPGDYYSDVVTSINAGLDMIMVPYDYKKFIRTLTAAVEAGDVPVERIDDAVRRILTVKFRLGLFEHPYANRSLISAIRSTEHLELAREAVRKSLVLLKNEGETLPLSKETALIYVAGVGADNIGMQCGGWTIEWQGKSGPITPGTTILDAIKATVSAETTVRYHRAGNFGEGGKADVGIVVVGELPYAEGVGDREDLSLSPQDAELVTRMREQSEKLVVILLSGRPMVVTEQLEQADAFVVAWWPGTEGQGIADVLFGAYPFTGKLPHAWPRAMEDVPLPRTGAAPLFPYGYGLD
ncbi:MAG: glycoside hydrolase family 3 C-terminal domain-containing protein [Anaerolineae bacterium]|nr:glycoside hydrolase family 3 C-terminal domain-containing protein [Anaerolineae bacterium]